MAVLWSVLVSCFVVSSSAWAFQAQKKPWTIFIFGAGDEVEVKEPTGLTLKRFEFVRGLKADAPVRVVAIHDEVDLGDARGDGLRYVLEHVENPSKKPLPDGKHLPASLIEEQLGRPFKYEDIDSGDPRTLKAFLKWGVKNYPADHYALILAGHSWGQQGLMQDFYVRGKKLDSSTMIKNYELRRVMQELYREEAALIPEGKFDLLLIDACTSGQLDVMLEWKEVFKYFAASALETPFNSIPYHEFMDGFIAAVKSSPASESDRVLENHFLKPLITTYVTSHSRGGSLVKAERQIDPVEYFAVRMDKLQGVADKLKALVGELPKAAYDEWWKKETPVLERVHDTDYNADLLALSRAFQDYGKEKKWDNVVDAAKKLEESFGYPAEDPTFAPVTFPFGEFEGSNGAWVSVDVDEVSPLRELAGCVGIKSFAMLNDEWEDLRPQFKGEEATLSAHRFRCNELGEAHHHKHPEPQVPKFGEAIPLNEIFDHKLTWPHGKTAVIQEYPDAEDSRKVGRRVLTFWVPRARFRNREIRLGTIAAGKVLVKYVDRSGKKLGEKRPKVPTHFWVTEFPAHSPYVAEGKGSGSHFKHGFGIYLERALHEDEWAYQGGRLPIERTKFKDQTIDAYLDHLEATGQLHRQRIKGLDFYRAHRIEETGWPRFLFSGLIESGTFGHDDETEPSARSRNSRRVQRSRRYPHRQVAD